MRKILILMLTLLPLVASEEVVSFNAIQRVLGPGLVELNVYLTITKPGYYLPFDAYFYFPIHESATLRSFHDGKGRAKYVVTGNEINVIIGSNLYYGTPLLIRFVFETPSIEFNGVSAMIAPVCIDREFVLSPEKVKFVEDLNFDGDYYFHDSDYCAFPFLLIEDGNDVYKEDRCVKTLLGAPSKVWDTLCSVYHSAAQKLSLSGMPVYSKRLTLVPYIEWLGGDVLCYEANETITCSSKLFFFKEETFPTMVHELVHVKQTYSAPIWFLEGTAASLEEKLTDYQYADLNECFHLLEENFWSCWEAEWWGSGCKVECNGYDTAYIGYAISSDIFEPLDPSDVGTLVLRFSPFTIVSPEEIVLVGRMLGLPEDFPQKYKIEYNTLLLRRLDILYNSVTASLPDYGIIDPWSFDITSVSLTEYLEELNHRLKTRRRVLELMKKLFREHYPCVEDSLDSLKNRLSGFYKRPYKVIELEEEDYNNLLHSLTISFDELNKLREKEVLFLFQEFGSCDVEEEAVRKHFLNKTLEELTKLNFQGALNNLNMFFKVKNGFRIKAELDELTLRVEVTLPWGEDATT